MSARSHRRCWRLIAIYAALMGASTTVRLSHREGRSSDTFDHVAMVHVVSGGSIGRSEIRLAYRRYEPHASTREPAIVVVHGSPGRKG